MEQVAKTKEAPTLAQTFKTHNYGMRYVGALSTELLTEIKYDVQYIYNKEDFEDYKKLADTEKALDAMDKARLLALANKTNTGATVTITSVQFILKEAPPVMYSHCFDLEKQEFEMLIHTLSELRSNMKPKTLAQYYTEFCEG